MYYYLKINVLHIHMYLYCRYIFAFKLGVRIQLNWVSKPYGQLASQSLQWIITTKRKHRVLSCIMYAMFIISALSQHNSDIDMMRHLQNQHAKIAWNSSRIFICFKSNAQYFSTHFSSIFQKKKKRTNSWYSALEYGLKFGDDLISRNVVARLTQWQ